MLIKAGQIKHFFQLYDSPLFICENILHCKHYWKVFFFLKMVSNLYLNRVLYFLREFKGTFSCNNLPPFTPTDKREFFIVNLSKVEEKGSHFIYLEKYNDIIFYWDPFGISLHNPYIINFLEKSKLSRVICISNIVQNINSISCGLYCLNLGMVFTKIIENRTNKLTSPLFF